MILPLCLAGGPVQMAYCVHDLAAAVEAWTAAGVAPFVVREHIAVDDVAVFGAPAIFDHSSAYGWWGGLMIELVQIHAPSALISPGLHHQAFFVDSFDKAAAELIADGMPEALTATAGSTRFGFFDARPTLGHFIEIYEGSEALRGFYAKIERASQSMT